MPGLEIRPVRTRRELKRFVKLPFRLHRDRPQWVAPLIFERMQFLDRSKNPYFEHAEAEYFLAERDGEAVGRITAQVDSRWDEFQGGSDGMFGFFESTDDPEVAEALLGTASEWVAGRGRRRILGPMDFTTNDELGLLIEGYDLRPMILQPWHPPYYRELLEGHGYTKAMDLLMWYLRFGELKEGERFDPAIHAAAKKALEEEGVTIRTMRRRDMENEIRRFMEVYNEAWERNWGFVPLTDAELEHYVKELRPVLDENWAMIAERDGETVGMALTLPDYNQVLKEVGGRLLPLGWLKALRARKRIDAVRVFALGVKRAYQHTGVAAGLYVRHFDMAERTPQKGGEMGWILETNKAMNRGMEAMGGRIVKRHRIYARELGEPVPAGQGEPDPAG
jgi:GNAT superfamily N-acetyltransferase